MQFSVENVNQYNAELDALRDKYAPLMDSIREAVRTSRAYHWLNGESDVEDIEVDVREGGAVGVTFRNVGDIEFIEFAGHHMLSDKPGSAMGSAVLEQQAKAKAALKAGKIREVRTIMLANGITAEELK